MKLRIATKRILSIILMSAMLLSMMPALLAFAAGDVEIISPAYGAVVEVGQETKIRVESETQPTITAGGSALSVTSAGDGVWDAAWIPATTGVIEVTAAAGDASDTIRVSGACSTIVIEEATRFDANNIKADKHWPGAAAYARTFHDDYTTLTIGKNDNTVVPAAVQYSTKDAQAGSTGVGPSTGIVVWEIDLRVPTNGNTIDLKHRNNDATNQLFFSLSPTDGKLHVEGDADNNWVKRFNSDEWFNLKTIFDMDTKTFTVYIDDVAVSVDNAITGVAAEAIDGLVLQMNSYYDINNLDTADIEGSFDIKNWSVRHEEYRSISITGPIANTTQETGYEMPVSITATGVLPGDTVSVTGSDGATAVATKVAGSKNQYLAYLAPQTASDTYTLTASITGVGRKITDTRNVKVIDTIQLGGWDFNDTSDVTGITAGSDNFYSAEKLQPSGDTVTWIGGVGGKDANDLSYRIIKNSSSYSALSFWPMSSVKYSLLVTEFDYYYEGTTTILSSKGAANGEVYIRHDNIIQHTGSWQVIKNLTPNTWYRVKIVYDKANNAVDFYWDGEHMFHRQGVYNATSNPNGVVQTVSNDTSWIAAASKGNLTVDNISIRTTATDADKALAKKVDTKMQVGAIGALKPGQSFTVNAKLPYMSKSADVYVNGVKSATMATANADGYYQATITAPAAAGEAEIKIVDNYGATETIMVPVQNPDLFLDFTANTPSGVINDDWSIWMSNTAWKDGKLQATSETAATTYQIQKRRNHPTNGTLVFEYDATIPPAGTGRYIPQLYSTTSKYRAIGYFRDKESYYDAPVSATKNQWTASSTNISAGEQTMRLVYDVAERYVTFYINGHLIYSYKCLMEDLPGINSFIIKGEAGFNNTLDNLNIFYIPPKTDDGGDGGEGGEGDVTPPAPTLGVSNVKFTTGRDVEVNGTVGGIRRITFDADILSESAENLRMVIATYQEEEDNVYSLIDAKIKNITTTASVATHVTESMAYGGTLKPGSMIKVFVWSNDELMEVFSDVVTP